MRADQAFAGVPLFQRRVTFLLAVADGFKRWGQLGGNLVGVNEGEQYVISFEVAQCLIRCMAAG